MKKGYVIYRRADYRHNRDYCQWLIDEANRRQMRLQMVLAEEVTIKNEVPDFVINRSRSQAISLLYELNQIPVYNQSEITRLGNDKLAAYRQAQRQKVPFMPILLGEVDGSKWLSKPNDGHGGQGIEFCQRLGQNEAGKLNKADGKPPIENTISGENSFRFRQLWAESVVGDVRFYLVANQIRQAVLRQPASGHLLANYSRGGRVISYDYGAEVEKLIRQLLGDLIIDYGAVDFLLLQDGSYVFNEIEDVAGSRMLTALGLNDTAPALMEHIRLDLKNR